MNEWFYDDNGTQEGPISKGSLQAKFVSGELKSTNRVWKEGMADWLPADQVDDLISLPAPSSSVSVGFGDTPSSSVGDSSASEEVSPYAAPQSVVSDPTLLPTGPYQPLPSTHLVQSIILTVLTPFCCCCLPLGVVPLVYACLVSSRHARGDYAGAQSASSTAKIWCIVLWVIVGLMLALRLLSVTVATINPIYYME